MWLWVKSFTPNWVKLHCTANNYAFDLRMDSIGYKGFNCPCQFMIWHFANPSRNGPFGLQQELRRAELTAPRWCLNPKTLYNILTSLTHQAQPTACSFSTLQQKQHVFLHPDSAWSERDSCQHHMRDQIWIIFGGTCPSRQKSVNHGLNPSILLESFGKVKTAPNHISIFGRRGWAKSIRLPVPHFWCHGCNLYLVHNLKNSRNLGASWDTLMWLGRKGGLAMVASHQKPTLVQNLPNRTSFQHTNTVTSWVAVCTPIMEVNCIMIKQWFSSTVNLPSFSSCHWHAEMLWKRVDSVLGSKERAPAGCQEAWFVARHLQNMHVCKIGKRKNPNIFGRNSIQKISIDRTLRFERKQSRCTGCSPSKPKLFIHIARHKPQSYTLFTARIAPSESNPLRFDMISCFHRMVGNVGKAVANHPQFYHTWA